MNIIFTETYSITSDELVLECRVRGQPRPHIAWIKEGDYLIPGDKYEQYDHADGTCKLIICHPTEDDCGTYSCEAESNGCSDTISHNVHFTGKSDYLLQKVHGFYHRNPNMPHFTTGLTDNSITSGGTIALLVECPGNPEVQWFKDKKPIICKPPKVNIFTENEFFGLCISAANMDESGAYTCRATNAFGKVETTSNVDIINPNLVKGQRPPSFLARPQTEIKIRQGDPLSMSFRVGGEPKPKGNITVLANRELILLTPLHFPSSYVVERMSRYHNWPQDHQRNPQ